MAKPSPEEISEKTLPALEDRFGISPLRVSAALGHLDVVKHLCSANARLEQADLEGGEKQQTTKTWGTHGKHIL